MTNRRAALTFAFWISVALLLDGFIYLRWGARSAAEFFGAWAMEQTLSLDNLFMFYFIFAAFGTPQDARPRALRWGIVGVVAMRGAIILGGTALTSRYEWVLMLFALFLFWAAWKIFFLEEKDDTPAQKQARLERNWLVRLANRFLSFDNRYHGDRFWVKVDGRWKPTLLLLVVLVVEGTDVPFAFDSLPAAMAISQDFWIVASSNLLAVLGLRSVYFLIENMQERFAHMQQGIGLLLGFAGAKIVLPSLGEVWHGTVGRVSPELAGVVAPDFGLHIPLTWSIGIIFGVIASTITYTLVKTRGANP